MTLGSLKIRVLSLLDRAFLDGEALPESYNGQADLVKRIPIIAADGLVILASGVCPLWESLDYTPDNCSPFGEGLVSLSLPPDRIRSLPIRLFSEKGEELCFGIRGDRVIVKSPPGVFSLCYGRLPVLPDENSTDDFPLDCAPELIAPLGFYVAAIIAESFDASLSSVLMGRFDALSSGLREAPWASSEEIKDVFGGEGL